jgi:gluconolactonase
MKRSTSLLASCFIPLVLMGAAPQDADAKEDPGKPVLGAPERLHGGMEFTEGPTPDAEGNVYFTDIPAERIHIHRPDGSLETFMKSSGKCNGLMFDKEGRLWACQGAEGRIIRIDVDTSEITPVADYIDGGPFLSTNDLTLDAHGGAYFTDPAYWRHKDSKVDEGVYYVAEDGTITRIAEGLSRPNGILLSPDGGTLYILPTGERRLIAHPVLAPGKIGPGRDLAALKAGGDGLTCDTEGNVYLTQPRLRSIIVFSPEGEELTSVKIKGSPSNVCFGGPELDHLYVTAGSNLFRIPVNKKGLAPGMTGRVETKSADEK